MTAPKRTPAPIEPAEPSPMAIIGAILAQGAICLLDRQKREAPRVQFQCIAPRPARSRLPAHAVTGQIYVIHRPPGEPRELPTLVGAWCGANKSIVKFLAQVEADAKRVVREKIAVHRDHYGFSMDGNPHPPIGGA